LLTILATCVRARARMTSASPTESQEKGAGIRARPQQAKSPHSSVALSESRYHADVHGADFGDRDQGFTSRTALQRFLALVGRELGLAAKLDGVRHGARPSASCARILHASSRVISRGKVCAPR